MANPSAHQQETHRSIESQQKTSTQSRLSTEADQQDDSDWTSSSGSSSEDETEGEDKQPRRLPKVSSNKDLRTRLATFLPQMEEANRELKDPSQALKHQIDVVGDDEEQYVEMNLGLGVLAEKQQDLDEIRTYQTDTDGSEAETSSATIGEGLNEKSKSKQQKKKKIIQEL